MATNLPGRRSPTNALSQPAHFFAHLLALHVQCLANLLALVHCCTHLIPFGSHLVHAIKTIPTSSTFAILKSRLGQSGELRGPVDVEARNRVPCLGASGCTPAEDIYIPTVVICTQANAIYELADVTGTQSVIVYLPADVVGTLANGCSAVEAAGYP